MTSSLVETIESLRADLQTAIATAERAETVARAERGFQLLGVSNSANPFAGAAAIHAKAVERVREMERKVQQCEADMAAVSLARAYNDLLKAQDELRSMSEQSGPLNERLAHLDSPEKRARQHRALQDSRFEGPGQYQRVSAEIAKERQADRLEQQRLIRELEGLTRSSEALLMRRNGLERQFPELKALVEYGVKHRAASAA